MAKIILAIDDKVLREITISKERITIGRRAHNDVVIDDIAVSAEHAVIVTARHDSLLEDLDSTNGTQVNGQPVKQHFLQNHDVIELARYNLRYIADAGNDACGQTAPAPDRARVPGLSARIKVLDGARAGSEIVLTKALTTIGRPGVQVAVVTHRPQGWCITHVEGDALPLINGAPASGAAHPLAHGDLIRLAGARMKFLLD